MQTTEKKSETSALIDTLRRAIISGEYLPRERLVEKDLAEKYNVSRTPVREALKHLSALGLVRLEQYRGAIVADYNPKAIGDMFVVRGWLEGLAGNLAAQKMTDEELALLTETEEKMEAAAKNVDIEEFSFYNETFHDIIYRGSGNKNLYDTLQQIFKQSWHEPVQSWQGFGDVPLVINQHQAILAALKAHDAAAAQELSINHTYGALYLTKVRHAGMQDDFLLPKGKGIIEKR